MSENSKLPFLAGYRYSDPYKSSFHKSQRLLFKQNTCVGKILNNNKITQKDHWTQKDQILK